MKINLSNAVSTFYPNPSYEQIYFEAFANALDAGANHIKIKIDINAFDNPETLQVSIYDNGIGFIDKNFSKFSQLLEVEKKNHKGLGRLVYLAYFEEICFESFHDNHKKRTFTFNNNFNGDSINSTVEDKKEDFNTSINFSGYTKDRIYRYDYLIPSQIKNSLIEEFYPLLLSKKQQGHEFNLEIYLNVDNPNIDHNFVNGSSTFNISELQVLEKTKLQDISQELFQNIDVFYAIKENSSKDKSIYTAICIDDRALKLDLLPIEAIPDGYDLKFIFLSDNFQGKSNTSRQKLELPDDISEKTLKLKLKREIGFLIKKYIPCIDSENEIISEELNNTFPHLQGYFPINSSGLIIRTTAIEEAQEQFFNDQKIILECEELDDERYKKALELSSRALAEYIVYRMRILSKLKGMNINDNEKELHKLFVPMRKTLKKEKFDDDIYNNNVWMLDDRFMSYNTILSDEIMSKVIKEIALDEIEDNSRPDITLVFSGNPEKEEKVDVVIVELKKHGVGLAKKEEVLSQLRQRARKLLKYYPSKINRIWFYGITDIDTEFRISLKEDKFKELFSRGQMFFKAQDIIVNDEDNPFIIDLFVMNYDSLIDDAESRNNTFLQILKTTIKKWSLSQNSVD